MRKFKMIIIDDEPNFADSLAEMLKCENLDLEICGTYKNGIQALEFMSENEIDIVLTDIKMPGMDGIEFVTECSQCFPDTMIIFMSAYSEFDAARFAIQNNVKGYLLKPISYNELVDLLFKLTEQLKKEKIIEEDAFNPLLFSYQQIFSQIFYGTIKANSALVYQWQTSGLKEENINLKHAVVRITLDNFSDYLENIWKREYYRFFDAMNSIIRFSSTMEFYIIKYSYNTLDLITFTEDNLLENYLEDNIKKISTTLFSELKIKNSIEILKIFNNVFEMLDYEFEQPKVSTQKNTDIIDTAIEFMEKNYSEDITLADVASHVFLSPAYFSVLFKQKTNENFTSMMNKIRIEAAKKLLRENDIKPTIVHQMVGFKSYTYFFKRFKNICGMTPNEYKNRFVGGEK